MTYDQFQIAGWSLVIYVSAFVRFKATGFVAAVAEGSIRRLAAAAERDGRLVSR
jgi:hypothetical protein